MAHTRPAVDVPFDPTQLRTVLCPVDFSNLSGREIDVAIELCQTFRARLILHHNLGGAPPALSKAWEWEGSHHPEERTDVEVEGKMRELLERVPSSVRVEARLTRGPVATSLVCLAEQLPADLLVLGCHGWTTEEHVSVTERLLERCPCPVLTIHEGHCEGRTFRLGRRQVDDPATVLVPTDFSPSAEEAVHSAFVLARKYPIRVHLYHVPESIRIVGARSPGSPGPLEEVQRQLEDLIPLDLLDRVSCHVETGSVSEKIVEFADRLHPDLMIMGRHARGLFRRFTRDTSRDLLHRACCPVWFVAGQPA